MKTEYAIILSAQDDKYVVEYRGRKASFDNIKSAAIYIEDLKSLEKDGHDTKRKQM